MELYFFTRRTPKTIFFESSISEPKRYRKAGTTKVTVRWTAKLPQEGRLVASRVFAAMKQATDRTLLECNLRTASQLFHIEGWEAEHLPRTGGRPECIKLTRKG